MSGLIRQVLQVSGLIRQVLQVSGLTRQVSQVCGLTRQVSQVSGLIRQVPLDAHMHVHTHVYTFTLYDIRTQMLTETKYITHMSIETPHTQSADTDTLYPCLTWRLTLRAVREEHHHLRQVSLVLV